MSLRDVGVVYSVPHSAQKGSDQSYLRHPTANAPNAKPLRILWQDERQALGPQLACVGFPRKDDTGGGSTAGGRRRV